MFKALTPHGYTLTLEALDQAPAFDNRLSEIKTPTLCIVGDEDPALEDVKFVHSQIDGSELVVVPTRGTSPTLTRPRSSTGRYSPSWQRWTPGGLRRWPDRSNANLLCKAERAAPHVRGRPFSRPAIPVPTSLIRHSRPPTMDG